MDDIYNQDPENLAIIRYHTWWPGANDPYYRANVVENDARINYYGVNYTPDLWIDGDIHGTSNYPAWANMIANEEGVPSPLTIDLSANYGETGDFGTITAVINAIDPITETGLKTRIAITESHLPGYGAFPEFNHVFRDMLPDAAGLDLVISQGQEVTKEATFTISNDWNLAELIIVTFVQSDDSHRILQTAKFIPPTGLLQGKVTNSENGFGVPGAGVTILNTSYGDSTDYQGNYFFPFFPGNRSIVVAAPGFNADTLDVVIAPADTTVFNISLQPVTTGSITGTVTDPDTDAPLSAQLTLYQNGNPLATVETDSTTGAYSFSGIVVSSPPSIVYTDLIVNAVIPYGIVTYGDTITVVEGTPSVIDFEISAANVFLVDDDEGENYEDYFKDEISATGRSYYHFDVETAGESAVNYIHLFSASSAIIWFTGDASSNTLTETEQDSLAKFLDQGGRLFLTGQNIVEDLDGAGSSFLQDYLHVSHGGNGSNIWGRGVENNPVTWDPDIFLTSGSGGANNQSSRDILTPVSPAIEFVHYLSSPTDFTPRGTAAVYVEGSNDSKAVVMGFGFESINSLGGDSTRANRGETMLGILNWFDGITGIGDNEGRGGGIALPKALALHQNYPNPFNPSTTIRYEIPASEESVPVELKLYDLRGRLVRSLVDKEQEPGSYTVHWNGRDELDHSVGSGIYLYRLEVGDQALTRKMTVLK